MDLSIEKGEHVLITQDLVGRHSLVPFYPADRQWDQNSMRMRQSVPSEGSL